MATKATTSYHFSPHWLLQLQMINVNVGIIIYLDSRKTFVSRVFVKFLEATGRCSQNMCLNTVSSHEFMDKWIVENYNKKLVSCLDIFHIFPHACKLLKSPTQLGILTYSDSNASGR
jgi:hypothetical protein